MSENFKWKCHGCGIKMTAPQMNEGTSNMPKENHLYYNDLCPTPKTGGSVWRDRKYHQFIRDYS